MVTSLFSSLMTMTVALSMLTARSLAVLTTVEVTTSVAEVAEVTVPWVSAPGIWLLSMAGMEGLSPSSVVGNAGIWLWSWLSMAGIMPPSMGVVWLCSSIGTNSQRSPSAASGSGMGPMAEGIALLFSSSAPWYDRHTAIPMQRSNTVATTTIAFIFSDISISPVIGSLFFLNSLEASKSPTGIRRTGIRPHITLNVTQSRRNRNERYAGTYESTG